MIVLDTDHLSYQEWAAKSLRNYVIDLQRPLIRRSLFQLSATTVDPYRHDGPEDRSFVPVRKCSSVDAKHCRLFKSTGSQI